MSGSNATLHILCGKIAAGKSTLSAKLGEAERTVVISEDRWIDRLYARSSGRSATISSGARGCALRLRRIS
jgi:predicted kinase